MKCICYAFLVFGTIFAASSNGEVTYYVKTYKSPNSTCPGQPCKSLLYYIDNAEAFFNREEKITMKFSEGVHSAYCFESDTIEIPTPHFAMIGEGLHATRVYCMDVHFNNTRKLSISQLEISAWNLTVTPASLKQQAVEFRQLGTALWILSVKMGRGTSGITVRDLTHVHIHNTTGVQHALTVRGPSTKTVKLSSCTFRDGIRTTFASMTEANVTVRDCMFINSPVFVYDTGIILTGISMFTGSQKSPALLLISGTVVLSGSVCFTDNSAFRGAAMALYSSLIVISPGADVVFANNSVYGEGGAIYIDLGMTKNVLLQKASIETVCFYQLSNCHENSSYSFHFANNSAERGGNDMYGASLQSGCESSGNKNCHLHVTSLQRVPSVSSDPTRVCVCDDNDQPQCTNESYISLSRQVHPGEVFTLPVVVVGGDLGPTVGVVHSSFKVATSSISLTTPSQYSQLLTTNKHCTQLNYSAYDKSSSHKQTLNSGDMHLTTHTSRNIEDDVLDHSIEDDHTIRTIPVKIHISLSPCPQGFTLLGEPPICDCYPELSTNGVGCKIINGRETFSWQGSLWIAVEREGVVYGRECPSNYCKIDRKEINIRSESDTQCAFNRAGRLCGGCKVGYSLAIGSSHCVPCSNNYHMGLLVFFAAAGFLLVCFINTLNLTVTQGMVNGIIFYANIVWRYQAIFFAKNDAENAIIVFFKAFVAWVNLDFGIETCFANGLTAFWKAWLEFVFPFYIWAIIGLIIVGTRHSSRLTRIFGSRAVSILSTLILLSYMKLLSTAVSALEFSFLTYSEYPIHSSKSVVWSVDANLAYLGIPHVFLFLAAIATLLFLWLPYTLLLLLAQWLRKLPKSRFAEWITQLHPVYDAYLAPLKHTHQYWFGVLLLVRGVLSVTFASTLGISAPINLFILLMLSIILLLYIAVVKPYNSAVVTFLQMSSIANLTALSGFFFFSYTQPNGADLRVIGVGLSTGAVFLKFCGIVLHAVMVKYHASKCSCSCKRKLVEEEGGVGYVGISNSQL